MRLKTIKVSELSEYISKSIRADVILKNIAVEGEISNRKYHQNGNLYFSIKDENSKIRCIMFSDDILSSDNFLGKDGDVVICTGSISYYRNDSSLTLIVKKIEKKLIDDKLTQFEIVKNKLEPMGLFDIKYKKELKEIPDNIGLITSSTGAVLHDIKNVITRRFPHINIFLYSSNVQGQEAENSVLKAIEHLDNMNLDAIIIARGGGSNEDMDVFNKESVAFAIFEAKTPIISAIGHETDTTISDLVADYRASTPSVAGEIVVPDINTIKFRLKNNGIILDKIINNYFDDIGNKIYNNKIVIENNSPINNLQKLEDKLNLFSLRIKNNIKDILEHKSKIVDEKETILFKNNPHSILDIGGGILIDREDNLISSIKNINENMEIMVKLKDGEFLAKVIKVV